MYCGENEEYVDYESCDDCMEDHYDGNPDHDNFKCAFLSKREERERKFKSLSDSKLIKEVRDKLSKSLSISDDKLNPILSDFNNSICDVSVNYLNEIIKAQVQIMCSKYFESKLKKQLDELFKKVITDEIDVLQSDDTFIKTSIQEKLLQKTKQFFSEKENYRNNDIKEDIDSIISKAVDSKVEIALEELKKETIEKFNTEAMKSMMKGMAKQLGSDKKLMKILTSGDFD